MKIYGTRTQGNPRRVAIFAEEKGLELPFESVDLMAGAHREPDFLALNPAGEVPVLVLDDGTAISETIAICRYLEALHPDPPLFGVDALDRARVEMWQRRVEFKLYAPAREALRHSAPFVRPLEPVQIEAWAALNRQRARAGRRLVDAALAKSEFIAGPRFSVADITAILVMDGVGRAAGLGVPDDCPHLARWLDAVAERPSVRATRPPD